MADQTSERVLERLFGVIAGRRGGDPDVSYTARLLDAGLEEVARKVGEEAVETLMAGMRRDHDALVHESADLLYHLLVLWAASNVRPDEVWAELARREGTSGLAEKAARDEP